jgi:adenylate kinase
MILLLFGPPGCGKGTQSAFLAEQLEIPAISTGEMFRAECEAGTELGRTICAILKSGGLVSDDMVNRVITNRISRSDCARGFLRDGYPRTVPQARAFADLLAERNLPEPAVIQLDVADSVLIGRLTARRQCPKCKHIFNLITQPPRVAGRCDADGEPLIERDDDREEVVRERLRTYKQQTDPILNFYSAGVVHRVDGAAPPEQVAKSIQQAIAALRAGLPAHAGL